MRGGPSDIDWVRLRTPIITRGDHRTAHRDPAAHYHDGVFRVFHSLVTRERDGRYFWRVGVVESKDLQDWTPPRPITPKNQKLNFSSPGNVVRHGERWILCLQTYPTPNNEVHADETARIWAIDSEDLVNWGQPELLRVKGPDVPLEEMGRMIDPYLVQDKDEEGKWWCFYKQNGMSFSYSYDLKTWTYFGRADAGENACVIVDGREYVLFHSPDDGIGVKRSGDLVHWRDEGLLKLGQSDWPWARGRLTAGMVLDLRTEPGIGRFLMFFHGSSRQGKRMWKSHGHASLAFAWSFDLQHWEWPGNGRRAVADTASDKPLL